MYVRHVLLRVLRKRIAVATHKGHASLGVILLRNDDALFFTADCACAAAPRIALALSLLRIAEGTRGAILRRPLRMRLRCRDAHYAACGA